MSVCGILVASFGRHQTYNVVVVAAHSVGRAAVRAANPDDGDRCAVDADVDVCVLENDAEQAQDCTGCRVARL